MAPHRCSWRWAPEGGLQEALSWRRPGDTCTLVPPCLWSRVLSSLPGQPPAPGAPPSTCSGERNVYICRNNACKNDLKHISSLRKTQPQTGGVTCLVAPGICGCVRRQAKGKNAEHISHRACVLAARLASQSGGQRQGDRATEQFIHMPSVLGIFYIVIPASANPG